MRVAMRKVDGVQNVEVKLKDGLTILELRAGNNVTLANLRTIIKYFVEPRSARLACR